MSCGRESTQGSLRHSRLKCDHQAAGRIQGPQNASGRTTGTDMIKVIKHVTRSYGRKTYNEDFSVKGSHGVIPNSQGVKCSYLLDFMVAKNEIYSHPFVSSFLPERRELIGFLEYAFAHSHFTRMMLANPEFTEERTTISL